MGKKVISVVTDAHADSTAQRPDALIRILHADGHIEERSLEIGRYDIGRASADIVLPGDRSVSRLHARIDVTPTDLTITDLGSTSGTFDARGMRLSAPRSLAPNDSVRIGSAVLSVIRLAVPTPSGVLRGTRSTHPTAPPNPKRKVTLPAIPAALRRTFDSNSPDSQLQGPQPPEAQLPEAQLPEAQLPEAQLPASSVPPAHRESVPAISGPRVSKKQRKPD